MSRGISMLQMFLKPFHQVGWKTGLNCHEHPFLWYSQNSTGIYVTIIYQSTELTWIPNRGCLWLFLTLMKEELLALLSYNSSQLTPCVLGTSSICTCRISNFEYLFWFFQWCLQQQQIFEIRQFQINELPRTLVR